MSEHKGREFLIMQEAAELLDTLSEPQQKQAMSFLATRYGLKLIETTSGGRSNYRPAPRRGKVKAW